MFSAVSLVLSRSDGWWKKDGSERYAGSYGILPSPRRVKRNRPAPPSVRIPQLSEAAFSAGSFPVFPHCFADEATPTVKQFLSRLACRSKQFLHEFLVVRLRLRTRPYTKDVPTRVKNVQRSRPGSFSKSLARLSLVLCARSFIANERRTTTVVPIETMATDVGEMPQRPTRRTHLIDTVFPAVSAASLAAGANHVYSTNAVGTSASHTLQTRTVQEKRKRGVLLCRLTSFTRRRAPHGRVFASFSSIRHKNPPVQSVDSIILPHNNVVDADHIAGSRTNWCTPTCT
ncbi:unnamed protein product [Rangifer tarandus platyrhynchus]|uniref:Uncharacterized protein n=1 Tax=Rangifer tarandus platyrhynchus TaxID=3082113 RepID=A0ABN8XMN0_RANTA|nr:unnamed protein product [Rangifer tarandus platyrhynchus]